MAEPSKPQSDSDVLTSTVLGQTLPSELFSAEATRELSQTLRHLGGSVSDSLPLATLLTQSLSGPPPSDLDLPPLRTLQADLNSRSLGQRYTVHEMLGRGAHGVVYAATDHTLEREVAIKVLRPDLALDERAVERFAHEACIAASLDHPGILPIFDYDLGDSGTTWYSMRRAEGIALDAALAETAKGRLHPALVDVQSRLEVFRRTCDAVAYAHHRGIVHQDLKPANVLLGSFGEVTVVDWGSALTAKDRESSQFRLMGTPMYLAPEQALRKGVDARSDVFALGATLLQILTLRQPVWSDQVDVFWERKRNGDIDWPTPRERRGWPRPLLSILRKALARQPEQRYQDAAALAEDLTRLRQGDRVQAHREGLQEHLARTWRRHPRAIVATLLASVLVLTIGALFVREKLKERTSWQMLAQEDFNDSALFQSQWKAYSFPDWEAERRWTIPALDDHVRIENDQLVLKATGGGYDCINVSWQGPTSEDLAFEWTVTPLIDIINANVFIGGSHRAAGYTFHIAGFGQPHQVTLTKGAGLVPIAVAPIPAAVALAVNKPTRGRVEKQGDHVRLWLDRQLIMDITDPEILVGPEFRGFGFECGSNKLAIDHVRVEHLPLPEKVDPIVLAHAFFSRGDYTLALDSYRQIINAYPDSHMARMASYRAGRCLEELGHNQAALEQLRPLLSNPLTDRLHQYALLTTATIYLSQDNLANASEHLIALGSPEVSEVIRQTAAEHVDAYLMRHYRLNDRMAVVENDIAERIERCRLLHIEWTRHLGLEPTSVRIDLLKQCARMLNQIGRHQEVLERYRNDDAAVTNALVELGRGDEALERFANNPGIIRSLLSQRGRHQDLLNRFPDDTWVVKGIISAEGRYDEALRRFPEDDGLRCSALLAKGRFREVLEQFPDDRRSVGLALIALHRYDEVIGHFPDIPWIEFDALLATGRAEEVLKQTLTIESHHTLALACLAIQSAQNGERARCFAYLDRLESVPTISATPLFERFLLPAFMRTMLGEDPAQSALTLQGNAMQYEHRFSGMVSRTARYLAGVGELESLEGVAGTPRELLIAMHAEMRGNVPEAFQHYQNLEPNDNEIVAKALISWRMSQFAEQKVNHAP